MDSGPCVTIECLLQYIRERFVDCSSYIEYLKLLRHFSQLRTWLSVYVKLFLACYCPTTIETPRRATVVGSGATRVQLKKLL